MSFGLINRVPFNSMATPMNRSILFLLSTLLLSACSGGTDSDDHTDSEGCHAAGADMSPETLADGTVDESYSQQFTAFGEGESFSLSSGDLPDGLTLTPSGLLEGTPTTAGDFQFALTFTVDDSESECSVHPAFGEYTLLIAEAG